MKLWATTALLCLGVAVFATYSEPIYGNCHTTAGDRVCDLVGYNWGK